MRYLVLSDIHANETALSAVLSSPQARSCDRILSLGDHLNFGPSPRAVQRRLEAEDAILLEGNHEERFSRIAEPAFSGYAWAILRWTYAQVTDLNLRFLREWQAGPVCATHAVPGNLNFLVDGDTVRAVLETLPESVTLFLSGHNHRTWRTEHAGKTAFNPGSAGMCEGEEPGFAPFGVLDLCGSEWQIVRHRVPYDLRAVRQTFCDSGAADAAPEMCRAVFLTMCTGRPHTVGSFVRHVRRTAQTLGLDPDDPEAWRAADRLWPWPEPLDSPAWWAAVRSGSVSEE